MFSTLLLLVAALIALVMLIILLFGLALYLCAVFPYSMLTPPFVPSSRKLTTLIAETLDLKPSSVMYELGAGDMRVSIACWRKEPNAAYIGIDKHMLPRILARFNIWRYGAGKQVSVHEGDLYATDLTKATHVYCYLFPQAMQKLLPKFQKELKSGSLVVSLDFEIKGEEPERTIDLTPYNLHLGKTLYVYRF